MSRPPLWLAATNISPCRDEARSQVGSRLAVASMANSKRPRLPGVRLAGRRSTSRTNASTSFAPAVDGSLRSPAILFDPLRHVEYGARRAQRQCNLVL